MVNKLISRETPTSEYYPDPIQKAKATAISSQLADMALAGDMPASRLFANLPAAVERDIWQEILRERKEISGHSETE